LTASSIAISVTVHHLEKAGVGGGGALDAAGHQRHRTLLRRRAVMGAGDAELEFAR
jgi:hypothetical protein